MIAALQLWPVRRWLAALVTAVGFTLLVGIPTDLIDTPLFWREIPPTWWAWPSLAVSSLLAGMLAASYIAAPAGRRDRTGQSGRNRSSQSEQLTGQAGRRGSTRGGWVGGVLTFFAVGCPVCNKLVLLALGSAGALTWFEPLQPLLQLAAIVLLAWALRVRLRGELSCPIVPVDREEARA